MIRRAVLADTGPLYAGVDSTDQYHQRALRERARLEESRLETVVVAPVLIEAHALCLYRLGREMSGQLATYIMSSGSFALPQESDYRVALQTTERYDDQSITLVDAIVAVMSKRLRLPVWTYDHHFDVMQVEVWRGG